MRLSEALVLKAEWWIAPAREYLDVEIEKLLDSELPETDWYYLASQAVKNNAGYHFRGTETESYLCLLESELQKDEEWQANLKSQEAFRMIGELGLHRR